MVKCGRLTRSRPLENGSSRAPVAQIWRKSCSSATATACGTARFDTERTGKGLTRALDDSGTVAPFCNDNDAGNRCRSRGQQAKPAVGPDAIPVSSIKT